MLLVRRLCAFAITAAAATTFSACAAPGADYADNEGDDPYKYEQLELSRNGRYVPPSDVKAAGEAQSGTYQSAGSWNGGRSCSGTFTAGARELGQYLVENFGATSFEGYSCRRNTADRSRLSMHGTGRAIDVMIPLDRGQADNGLGDPVANYLIRNATEIGVQFFIWDRTKWNIRYSGRKDKSYGGPHPHHDHLHIELSAAGSQRSTPWFNRDSSASDVTPVGDSPADSGGTPADSGDTPEPTPDFASGCTETCPYSGDGDCDDGGDGSAYSVCEFGTDCRDCGSRGTAAPPTPSTDPAPSEPATTCSDTCRYARDGACDDGGEGSTYSECALGTDCSDCGSRGASSSTPVAACGDGWCDAGESCETCSADCGVCPASGCAIPGHGTDAEDGGSCSTLESWRCVYSARYGSTVSQVCRSGRWLNFHTSPRSCDACCGSYSSDCRQAGS